MAEVSGEVKKALREIMSKSNEFIRWEVASRDTIEVKRIYVDLAGDLAAGVLLSQIIYWYLPSKADDLPKVRILKEGKLWLAKSRKDWWEECRLTPDQVDRCLSILEKRGLITKKVFKFSGDPTTHIWLNLGAVEGRVARSISPIGDNDLAKNREPTIYTETTSEITTRNSDFLKKPSEEDEDSTPNQLISDGISPQAAKDKAKDPPPVAVHVKSEIESILKAMAEKFPDKFRSINQWVQEQINRGESVPSVLAAIQRLDNKVEVDNPVGFLNVVMRKIVMVNMEVAGINDAIKKNGEGYRVKVKEWEKEINGVVRSASVISNLMAKIGERCDLVPFVRWGTPLK